MFQLSKSKISSKRNRRRKKRKTIFQTSARKIQPRTWRKHSSQCLWKSMRVQEEGLGKHSQWRLGLTKKKNSRKKCSVISLKLRNLQLPRFTNSQNLLTTSSQFLKQSTSRTLQNAKITSQASNNLPNQNQETRRTKLQIETKTIPTSFSQKLKSSPLMNEVSATHQRRSKLKRKVVSQTKSRKSHKVSKISLQNLL